MKVLYNEDVFPAGKHSGKTVEQVCKKDPTYILKFNSISGKSGYRNNLAISDEVLESLQDKVFED